jgi:ABC-type transport system involved in multi-copper enzyme maturation permease subunit
MLMLRRKLFWVLYILGMLIFLLFFFGQYLAAFAETATASNRPGQINLRQLIHQFLTFLNGTGETYRTFINYQGYIIMVVLALAGSVLIGNDLRHGSLPYYLSKPLSPWHYLLGKALAVAVFINLMTTVPAVLLYVEFAMLYDYTYFWESLPLLLGILGYGLVLTVSLSLLLLASAMWLRTTVPLIMMWTTLFVFGRLLAGALVGSLGLDPHWRLIDLWNNTFLVGNACLGMDPGTIRPSGQPAWQEAALVLGGVSLACLCYLILRIRAVEIVR